MNLEQLSKSFQAKYIDFVDGCDALEECDLWDKEQDGEMDGYYQNDLVSIIIRLITVDGFVSENEVKYLNEVFGFEYTIAELKEVCELCQEGIDELFDGAFASGIKKMRAINDGLADLYAEMLSIVCDIISASDGVVSVVEADTIAKLKAQCE